MFAHAGTNLLVSIPTCEAEVMGSVPDPAFFRGWMPDQGEKNLGQVFHIYYVMRKGKNYAKMKNHLEID